LNKELSAKKDEILMTLIKSIKLQINYIRTIDLSGDIWKQKTTTKASERACKVNHIALHKGQICRK
jgi:hypothetical protein